VRWRRDVVILLSLAGVVGCSSEESADQGGTTSSTSSSSAASSGSAGGGPDGGPPPPGSEAFLALACEDDSVCGPGGRCLRATDDSPLGGGPAGGYCSRACAADVDCPGLYSLCVKDDTSGEGACFLGCQPGPPSNNGEAELPSEKCHAREDLRCAEAIPYPGTPFPETHLCLPTCGVNAQCPAGRVCDPRDRLCVTTPHSGLPMGEKCDGEESCAGVCVTFSGEVSVCSSLCVFGGELEGTTDCGGLASGLCSQKSSPQFGGGDEGLCIPACDEHDDCAHPSFWCRTTLGPPHPGYCAMGMAACPSGTCAKGTCTETTYGPICLDPYPLGSAAP
jgi:hypothetical protein